MKKIITLVIALACVLAMAGCNTKSMDYIIDNKPNVTGIVQEVHNDYVIMHSDTAVGYPNGSEWQISLKVENKDSYTDLSVGDEIVVYHDGNVMETDPLRVGTVYAITLKTPADRAENNIIPSISDVSQMKYSEVNEALSGKDIQEIRDAWGEPAESDGKKDVWQLDESMLLMITYNDTGTIESCELVCGTPLAPADIPEDFSFALVWNCYGISSYDSRTGKLVKTTDVTNLEDYITYYQLTDEDKEYIYNLLVSLDAKTYPDIYDPKSGMSEPPMTLILTVRENGEVKTIKAENISLSFVSEDEKGQQFLSVCEEICKRLTTTDEWKALPAYEKLYE